MDDILRAIPQFYIESPWQFKEFLKANDKDDTISEEAKQNNPIMYHFTNMTDVELYKYFNNLTSFEEETSAYDVGHTLMYEVDSIEYTGGM